MRTVMMNHPLSPSLSSLPHLPYHLLSLSLSQKMLSYPIILLVSTQLPNAETPLELVASRVL
jgi:hypothetical protein